MINIAKQARDILMLSTSELARQLGVSRNTVDQWIRRERRAPAIAVTALMQMLYIKQTAQFTEYLSFTAIMERKMEMTTLIDNVNNAESLVTLRDSLNELAEYIRNSDSEFVQKIDDVIKTSELKTFGNNAPTDTNDIYSWDDDNYLMYGNDWYIESRNDIE